MTRQERSIQNSIEREKRAKKLVMDTITGLYSHEFKWVSGKWNIKAIAEHTGLHRDTVSKHLNALFNPILVTNLAMYTA